MRDERRRARKGGRAESRGNDSRPRVYVHFHFDASPAFHPAKVARHSANSPTEYQQRVIKRDDRDTRIRGYGRERGIEAGKGLRTCGKRPVVSGSLKSDYDVR